MFRKYKIIWVFMITTIVVVSGTAAWWTFHPIPKDSHITDAISI
ncbi:hypothetical protein [Fodinisporobacter ferrooxydans]